MPCSLASDADNPAFLPRGDSRNAFSSLFFMLISMDQSVNHSSRVLAFCLIKSAWRNHGYCSTASPGKKLVEGGLSITMSSAISFATCSKSPVRLTTNMSKGMVFACAICVDTMLARPLASSLVIPPLRLILSANSAGDTSGSRNILVVSGKAFRYLVTPFKFTSMTAIGLSKSEKRLP